MKNLLSKILLKKSKTGRGNYLKSQKKFRDKLPYITIEDTVVFPDTIAPLLVKDSAYIKAYESVVAGNSKLVVGYNIDRDKAKSLRNTYRTGLLCRILQVLKLPDGSARILVEGLRKIHINSIVFDHFYIADFKSMPSRIQKDKQLDAMMKITKDAFIEFIKITGKIPDEVATTVSRSDSAVKLLGNICFVMPIPYSEKIGYFLEENQFENLENIATTIKSNIEIIKLQQNLNGRVKKTLDRSQRNYFLNEQIKEIHKELGNDCDESEIGQLLKAIDALDINKKDKEKLKKDGERLQKLQVMSQEAGLLQNYLETITQLPWNKKTIDEGNLNNAKNTLDNDHYNMVKAKDRILDFVAVRQFGREKKSPVICLVGPPGTGKTSLGKSVANALNREFGRISLGGVKDEAEIRGHRKTYIGALPGKIIQAIKKTGFSNPVILLDEVDKIASDYKGDPVAALLEVLDPEQNHTFTDHYIEVPFDLSDVLFIATANSLSPIPAPLMDRMEVIEIQGYTELEKIEIATQFIIPKQLKSLGLEEAKITFSRDSIIKIIGKFTRESGVRSLSRNIATVLRKIARISVEKYETSPQGVMYFNSNYLREYPEFYKWRNIPEKFTPNNIKFHVTKNNLNGLLGDDKIPTGDIKDSIIPGYAVGLAWTQMGGTVLPIEISLAKGTGKLILTGQLGDVMKESAQIALSYVKSNCELFGIEPGFNKKQDIHIHAPEGAIPKDGPSAGITITSALISAIRGICINKHFGMTGEITLTGQILPIGGLKEKILAAGRNKCKYVLIPELNRRDIKDIPQEIQDTLEFYFHSNVKDAIFELFPNGTFK